MNKGWRSAPNPKFTFKNNVKYLKRDPYLSYLDINLNEKAKAIQNRQQANRRDGAGTVIGHLSNCEGVRECSCPSLPPWYEPGSGAVTNCLNDKQTYRFYVDIKNEYLIVLWKKVMKTFEKLV